MKKFTIYPAIDLRGGKVVRLLQGKSDKQIDYSTSSSEIANLWIMQGAEWLHVVNLDAVFGEPSEKNKNAIQSIIRSVNTKVKIQLGGGIRTIDQISSALDVGISRIVLGTSILENPAFGEAVIRKFGGEKIAFGFDVLGKELMSRGWQTASGRKPLPLARRLALAGAKTIIYTNIARDGMQTGVDWQNAKILSDQTGLDVIASGGTKSILDIKTICKAGLAGVIVGRALYEGNFSLKEILNAH